MTRLPVIGGDNGTWGTELNSFLSVSHDSDGTIAAAAITEAGAGGITLGGNPQWFPLYKSGNYYLANSPGTSTTSGSLTNNQLRISPFIVTKSMTITRIGCEFTAAGEANSIFRMGIYADDGTGLPGGAAVLDAGSISTGTGNAGTVATGGTPGVYEITVSTALTAGLYWIGGAVQGAPSTQPTMRVVSTSSIIFPMPIAAIPSAGLGFVGYQMGSVSGALPTWSGSTTSANAVRAFFKVS
jgi:hypothetical protein